MARKDFDAYFYSVAKQYQELSRVLQDLSEDAEKGIVEPERITQLKATIQPVKTSYDTLSYINYLLNKPTRKSKHAKYNRQNKKVIAATESVAKERVIAANRRVIDGLKP